MRGTAVLFCLRKPFINAMLATESEPLRILVHQPVSLLAKNHHEGYKMTWTFGDRTARFGLRGRRRPTPFGLPDAQGIVLAGRQWAENPAAALLDHCAPREAAKLFEEPGGMNPSSSRALVRRAVSGRKGSGRPWTREAETGEAARRLARRGSPRRGQRSMPGVLRDGQFPGRGRQKTLGFGPEAGKATAQPADRSCPQGAARTGCRRRA